MPEAILLKTPPGDTASMGRHSDGFMRCGFIYQRGIIIPVSTPAETEVMDRASFIAESPEVGGRSFGKRILPGVYAHFPGAAKGRDHLIGCIGFLLMFREQLIEV